MRRRVLARQKRFLIVGVMSLFLFLTIGYAAFSTTVSLTAKGNVIPAVTYTVDQLKATTVTTGDGLYTDPDEPGRYVFKGENPNNYLTLNNETWRIMSIESDNTLKIIREASLGNIVFDPGRDTAIAGITESGSDVGTRYSTTSTDFCYYESGNNGGCKVWGSKDTMRNSEGVLLKNTAGGAKIQRVITDATTYNLPNDEAYLNVYLNGGTYAGVTVAGWYQTWSSNLDSNIESYIEDEHIYNVGAVSNTSGQLTATDIAQEKALTWKGRVGLMTTSEYVRASTNPECTGVNAYYSNSACYDDGASHNYLRKTTTRWTVSPRFGTNPSTQWDASSANVRYNSTINPYGVHPVLYLSSNVQLKGDGTTGSKFQIKT